MGSLMNILKIVGMVGGTAYAVDLVTGGKIFLMFNKPKAAAK
jgi:hypothetical protein